MIKLSSSLHTLNRSPPYQVPTKIYVKPLVNTIIIQYTPTKQYISMARWNVQHYWYTCVRVEGKYWNYNSVFCKTNQHYKGLGVGVWHKYMWNRCVILDHKKKEIHWADIKMGRFDKSNRNYYHPDVRTWENRTPIEHNCILYRNWIYGNANIWVLP